MKPTIGCDIDTVSVCRRIAWIPEQKAAGGAERAERREGKIKQSGTLSGRFGKLLLSAHWLGWPRAALHSRPNGAACCGNPLVCLAPIRHHRPESKISGRRPPASRP